MLTLILWQVIMMDAVALEVTILEVHINMFIHYHIDLIGKKLEGYVEVLNQDINITENINIYINVIL